MSPIRPTFTYLEQQLNLCNDFLLGFVIFKDNQTVWALKPMYVIINKDRF